MHAYQTAFAIAVHSLRACYQKNGIIAGPHHFTDYWARDGYFAAFGSLAIGDSHIVKKQLQLFFSCQRHDGLIPYRIMRGPISLSKYLGKPTFFKKPKPTYKLRGLGNEVLDGTTLTVLFTAILKENQYVENVKHALQYLQSREIGGLLNDGFMAEWNDAIWKKGNLLYSNIIYWYMYKNLYEWQRTTNPAWSKLLLSKQNAIADTIRKKLWNGKYFADWHDYTRHDFLYPFGNCLAIAWKFTSALESASILNECKHVKTTFTLPTNAPKYPWWRVDFLQRLLGMKDYQNHGVLWWQPITSYLVALKVSKQQQDVDRVIQEICKKIADDVEIYECYESNGKPLKRFLYQAEKPFAWSSGMLVWALAYNTQYE